MNTKTKNLSKTLAGRVEEIDILEQLYSSKQPEFLALYGRRRVGKTFLIRQFFSNKDGIFFNVTGAKNGTLKEQLLHFSSQLSAAFYKGVTLVAPRTWDEAFGMLTNAMQQEQAKKLILFFDEIPWMATKKSRLLQGLDYFWNQHWSNDARIKLIICGSSASWVINKVINDTGGLHNRITRTIRLNPFNLKETKCYLNNVGVKLKNQQILLLYMVTGGVPYYLSNIKKGLSALQIIEKLAFDEKGVLYNEFGHLFSSLFEDADICIQIVRELSKHPYGVGKRELLKRLDKSLLGGRGIKRLEELEEANFIMSFTPYLHKRQGVYYRLVDEYVLFYLKWIEPIKKTLQKKTSEKGYWHSIQHSPFWYSWLGYAFELVCYNHIAEIRKALSVPGSALANSWRYAPRKGKLEQGAQIDLLFDRNDSAITICEIKYSEEPFILTKEYASLLKRKMDVFKERTRTNKQLFLALVAANGVKNNLYADDMLDGIATLDDLFVSGV